MYHVMLLIFRNQIKTRIQDGSIEDALEAFREMKHLVLPLEYHGLERYQSDCVKWAEMRLDGQLSHMLSQQLAHIGWPKEITADHAKSSEMDELLNTLDYLILFSSYCQDADVYQRAAKIMVHPIALRFKFHYATDRPTNRIDKPEWYLSHLIQVALTHEALLRDLFELNDIQTNPVQKSTLLQTFVKQLIAIAKDHVAGQKERVLNDPFILLHTVDEITKFSKIIAEAFSIQHGFDVLDSLLSDDLDVDAWIGAQYETSIASIDEILEKSDSWLNNELVPGSTGVMMADLIEILGRLINTLYALPRVSIQIEFLTRVLRPALEAVYDKIDFEIPPFNNTRDDIHILIIQANALDRFIDTIKNDWGGSAEAIELAGSAEYQSALGYDGSALSGSIFNRTIISFQGLLDRILVNLYDHLWDSFYSPAMSYARAMHYGVTRSRGKENIAINDDLRKAMVAFSGTLNGVMTYLSATCQQIISARLLAAIAHFLYERLILQNFYRPEYIPQFASDFAEIRLFLKRVLPEQQHIIDTALLRPVEAVNLISLSEADRESLKDAIIDEDLDVVAEKLHSAKVSLLSVAECEAIINLVKS